MIHGSGHRAHKRAHDRGYDGGFQQQLIQRVTEASEQIPKRQQQSCKPPSLDQQTAKAAQMRRAPARCGQAGLTDSAILPDKRKVAFTQCGVRIREVLRLILVAGSDIIASDQQSTRRIDRHPHHLIIMPATTFDPDPCTGKLGRGSGHAMRLPQNSHSPVITRDLWQEQSRDGVSRTECGSSAVSHGVHDLWNGLHLLAVPPIRLPMLLPHGTPADGTAGGRELEAEPIRTLKAGEESDYRPGAGGAHQTGIAITRQPGVAAGEHIENQCGIELR